MAVGLVAAQAVGLGIKITYLLLRAVLIPLSLGQAAQAASSLLLLAEIAISLAQALFVGAGGSKASLAAPMLATVAVLVVQQRTHLAAVVLGDIVALEAFTAQRAAAAVVAVAALAGRVTILIAAADILIRNPMLTPMEVAVV